MFTLKNTFKILGILILGYIIIKVFIYLFVFLIAGLGMNQVISNERYDCECSREKLLEEFLKFRKQNTEKISETINEEIDSAYGYSTKYLLNENLIYDVRLAYSFDSLNNTNTIMLGAFHKKDNYEDVIKKDTKEYLKYRNQFEREFIDKLGVECIRRE